MKRNSPVPVADPKHRSMEERQKMLKQRGEKVRKKRRRTKQEEKKLMTESKQEVQQLQMDGGYNSFYKCFLYFCSESARHFES